MAEVLFLSGEYPPDAGGVGDYTACLRAALADRGLATAVLARARRAPPAPGVFRLVRRWDAGAFGLVARLAPRQSVVHLQFQAAAFDLRGEACLMPLALRLRRPDLRVGVTFHDVRVPYLFRGAGLARLRPASLRLLAHSSRFVLAADRRDLRALGLRPSPRHRVVPIGANVRPQPPADYDRAAFRVRLGLGPGELAVAYFGFLSASKGLETLVASLAHLARRQPGTRLLLLGGAASSSDPAERGEVLEALGSAEVIRPGYLPAEQLSAYLLAADVALLPYRDGASPRRGSLLACAAHGLPIVTTSPVAEELAECVLACQPEDGQGLAEAVLSVAEDAALRARLVAASRRLAERVAWPAIARQHLEVYGQL